MGHENCSDMLKKATLDNKDREGTLEKQPDDLLFLLNTIISCFLYAVLPTAYCFFFVGATTMLLSSPTDQRHHKNEKAHKKQLLYV